MKLRDLWNFFTLENFVENIFWSNHLAALFLVLKVIFSKKAKFTAYFAIPTHLFG